LAEETASDDAEFNAESATLAAGGLVAISNGILTNVHGPRLCEGTNCWVHNPSRHQMVAWPIKWRSDQSSADRQCEHDVGHPDPDDASFNMRRGRDVSVHYCDGCCMALSL
jgi:hypothetical protein